jgi:hypothetical protein
MVQGLLLKGTYSFKNCLRRQLLKACAHKKYTEKCSSLNLSPIEYLKGPSYALPYVFYNTTFLIIGLSAHPSPLY